MVLIFSKVQDDAFGNLDIFNATGYNNYVITYITYNGKFNNELIWSIAG